MEVAFQFLAVIDQPAYPLISTFEEIHSCNVFSGGGHGMSFKLASRLRGL